MLRRARVAREMAIDFPCFKKIKNIKIKEKPLLTKIIKKI